MASRHMGRSAAGARRRRSLFVLIAMAAVMVPAAIAWACNPQAHISLNNTTYGPGETITVSGSYFNSSTCGCTVSAGGSSTSASGSSWTATLTAPSQPGSYTVVAQASGADSHIMRTASYQVVDTSASGPTGSEQSSSGQAFKEPKVGSTGGGAPKAGGTGGGEPKVGGVGGGGGSVQTGSGQPAFAGSVAATPGGSSFFAGGEGTASAATGQPTAQPSERAAVSDVWSGYAAGKTPSLTSGAAVPDGDTGSELSLGIVLLAVGLLALVAGLTTAEVMRRRAQVR
jgi:IPT/TIG domain